MMEQWFSLLSALCCSDCVAFSPIWSFSPSCCWRIIVCCSYVKYTHMLNIGYVHALGLSVFLQVSVKPTDTNQTEQYHRNLRGQCRYVAWLQCETEEVTFCREVMRDGEQLWYNFVWITGQIGATEQMGGDLKGIEHQVVSDEKWSFERDPICNSVTLRCPLVDVLVNIHASVKE